MQSVHRSNAASGRPATLTASPDTVQLDTARTVVLVIDMQNDFGAEGGMFQRAGIDISSIQKAVAPTQRALAAARAAGIPIIYLKMAFKPDLSDAGPVDSPNYARHQRLSVGKTVSAPDGSSSRILIRDTWNTDILPALAPTAADIVIYKHRFSGFFETELDQILKRLDAKYLIVTGCTTSICVDSTVRDAMFRDYHCIVLEDCTAEPIGEGLARSNHDATLLSLQVLLGWTSSSAHWEEALGV